MGIADDLTRLKLENVRLKWIVAQMMQRWSKDGFALFLKHNSTSWGILIEENSKQIIVRIKKADNEPADAVREVDPT